MLVLVGILLTVAFVTLLEQKILRFSQLRVGPQKTGFLGLLQPLADGLKLFTSELILVRASLKLIFLVPSFAILTLILTLTLLTPSLYSGANIHFTLLFFISVLGGVVYFVITPGLVISSKFSLLGSVRALVQTVSYEVRLFILILRTTLVSKTFQITFISYPFFVPFLVFLPFLTLLWFVSALAETSRAPFDFREGESELVSGFNTEYGSSPFALFFIGEYGFLILIRLVFRSLFLGGWSAGFIFLFRTSVLISLFV